MMKQRINYDHPRIKNRSHEAQSYRGEICALLKSKGMQETITIFREKIKEMKKECDILKEKGSEVFFGGDDDEWDDFMAYCALEKEIEELEKFLSRNSHYIKENNVENK